MIYHLLHHRTSWDDGRITKCSSITNWYECCIWWLEYVLTSWWRHQMETFSAILALCAGNSPVTGEFPSQRPVTQSSDIFFGLLYAETNGWINNRDAGGLRRHCAHYDATIMLKFHDMFFEISYYCKTRQSFRILFHGSAPRTATRTRP